MMNGASNERFGNIDTIAYPVSLTEDAAVDRVILQCLSRYSGWQ
jgi:hypothetical protein